MAIAEKIRVLRARQDISQRELGKKTGVSYTTISKVESGQQQNISARVALALARYFRVTPEDLIDDSVSSSALLAKLAKSSTRGNDAKELEEIPLKNLVEIPVLTYVPCGMSEEIPEEMVMGKISLPLEWIRDRHAFAVVAKGGPMVGHGIRQGDYVVISRTLEVRSGDIALVELNGEVTVRKFFDRGKQTILQSGDSEFQPIVVTERDDFRVVGKVVFSGRKHD